VSDPFGKTVRAWLSEYEPKRCIVAVRCLTDE